ncbi:MAG: hypothetical protein Q8M03_11690 [Legionella sp.]|nr:hypothetical protein [Legionella sp.]
MRQINVIVDSNDWDVTLQFVELCKNKIENNEYQWNFVATEPDKHSIPAGVSFTHAPFALMKISYYFDDNCPGSELADHILLEKLATHATEIITPFIEAHHVLKDRLEKSKELETLNITFAILEKNKRSQYEALNVARDIHKQLESFNSSLPSQSLFKPKPALPERSENPPQHYRAIPKGPFLRKLGVIGLAVVGIGGLAFMAEPLAWMGGIALLTISPPAFFATLAIVLTVIAASFIGACMLYKLDKSIEKQANSNFSPA